MFKIAQFFCFILGISCVQAQQVINTAGLAGKTSDNYTVAYNVGEPITTTFSANSTKLTQGFLQSEITVKTAIYVLPNTYDCSFSIYPNPTSDKINLDKIVNKEFEIISTQGYSFGVFIPDNSGIINIEQLPVGIYFIRTICGSNGDKFFTSLKFIKQ